jgi:hypothetical protein
MAKSIRKSERLHEDGRVALGELIHAQVRVAIERAVHDPDPSCLALELFELNALHLHQVTRRSSWGRYT